jgi:hypothetical protein
VRELAAQLHKILFDPQVRAPIKTLDLPLSGSASPVDALGVLVDFLAITNSRSPDKIDSPSSYADDETGDKTVEVLRGGLRIANRITGNSAASLGLHPAVYFSNDRGKHNRFLFLGIAALITQKVRNNDADWFRKFTAARQEIEDFLIENKSLIGIVLQNLAKRAASRR